MLIEIHILQNHAPSNLNRDDTGSPKEAVFGGFKRARISSQCLKRSIRRSDIFEQALGATEEDRTRNLATRTRQLPEIVRERLQKAGFSEEMAAFAAEKTSGIGNKAETAGKFQDGKMQTAQSMFLTEHDINAVVNALQIIAEGKSLDQLKAAFAAKKKGKKKTDEEDEDEDTGLKLQSLVKSNGFSPISVDVALFGRMTTSEAFRDVDASVQVAHALSTHQVSQEFDYYTAVDDLQGTEEGDADAGADMIGDVEFNSACYYKYFSVDFHGLVRNLTGQSAFRTNVSEDETTEARRLAARAMAAFLRAAIQVTPTGKQNSFAAHQLPAAVLIEVRPQRTPVGYTNAFVEPARADKGDDMVRRSLVKFKQHVEALTNGFNLTTSSRLLLAPEHTDIEIAGVERIADLNTLIARLDEVMQNA